MCKGGCEVDGKEARDKEEDDEGRIIHPPTHPPTHRHHRRKGEKTLYVDGTLRISPIHANPTHPPTHPLNQASKSTTPSTGSIAAASSPSPSWTTKYLASSRL